MRSASRFGRPGRRAAWLLCAGVLYQGGIPAAAAEDAVNDELFWQSVKGCTVAEEVALYIEVFEGRGKHLAEARACLKQLGREDLLSGEEPPAPSEIDELLAVCAAHFRADRLTTGIGGTAVECYQEVLSRDPTNVRALEGLEQVVQKYVGWAQRALEQGRVEKVLEYAEKLEGLNPESPQAEALRSAAGEIVEERAAETQRRAAEEAEAQRRAEEEAEAQRLAEEEAEAQRRAEAEAEAQRLAAAEAEAQRRAAEAEAQRRPSREVGWRFRECDFCPEMIVLPAGSFEMGSPAFEAGRDDDEGPVHSVTIHEPFAAGVYEVTRGEFRRFVEETGHEMADTCRTYQDGVWEYREGFGWLRPGYGQDDSHPVVGVRWNDAKAYVRWLSGRTGQPYRLMSESEWEYAARGGEGAARHWGNDPADACEFANGGDQTTRERYPEWKWPIHLCRDGYPNTAPVGSLKPNQMGLHDMLGNAAEWVEDCWNNGYAGAPSTGAAREDGNCIKRVVRGGSWSNNPRYLRSASRGTLATVARYCILGFRVARTILRLP